MGLEGDKLAHLAAVQNFFAHHMRFGKALVLPNHQVFAVFPCRSHHGLAVFQGGGHGLFTQHMFARAQRLNGHGRMGGVGRAHAYRVHAGCQQLFHCAVCLAAKPFCKFLGPAGHNVIECGQLAVWVFHIFGRVPHFGNFAAPDDAYFDHIVASCSKGRLP